nr:MAG TPA: hypothetical protein [Caudoviricetes sp.]
MKSVLILVFTKIIKGKPVHIYKASGGVLYLFRYIHKKLFSQR